MKSYDPKYPGEALVLNGNVGPEIEELSLFDADIPVKALNDLGLSTESDQHQRYVGLPSSYLRRGRLNRPRHSLPNAAIRAC